MALSGGGADEDGVISPCSAWVGGGGDGLPLPGSDVRVFSGGRDSFGFSASLRSALGLPSLTQICVCGAKEEREDDGGIAADFLIPS